MNLKESYTEICKDLRKMYGIRAFGYSGRCENRIPSQVSVIVKSRCGNGYLAAGCVSPRIRVISLIVEVCEYRENYGVRGSLYSGFRSRFVNSNSALIRMNKVSVVT